MPNSNIDSIKNECWNWWINTTWDITERRQVLKAKQKREDGKKKKINL